MHFTIFDTPILRTLFKWICVAGLRLTGWKLEGSFPERDKYMLIVAPHTSNWDFVIGLCMIFAFEQQVYWMGKDSLFRFPFGPFMRWLGGIPVDRRRSSNAVNATISAFARSDRLIIATAPEGTRKRVEKWRTGFYWVAHGAGLPILMGYIDFSRKVGGIGPFFVPTGDIDADMPKIRAFYAGVSGKRPDLF